MKCDWHLKFCTDFTRSVRARLAFRNQPLPSKPVIPVGAGRFSWLRSSAAFFIIAYPENGVFVRYNNEVRFRYVFFEDIMAEKILIVDDDLDTLRLVGLMLQKIGYQISAASNGEQG